MPSGALRISTVHFGDVEISPDQVIHLIAPLPPFSAQKRYLLLADPQEDPFLWLQCVDEPALAMVVAAYAAVTDAAAPVLSRFHREELALRADEQPEVYVMISLGPNSNQATGNLLAPLYVCRRTLRARQVVGDGDLSLTRMPLF